MSKIKKFESFDINDKENKENRFIIGWGLGGGFGGIKEYSVIKIDEEDAEKALQLAIDDAYNRSIREYEDYEGLHGLRSIEDIVEEDEVSYEDAEYIYIDERESWLDYVAYPYTDKLFKKFEPYGIEDNT